MLNINKIINNPTLLKNLTNYNQSDFNKTLLRFEKLKRSIRKLKTAKEQLFYKLFMEFVNPTHALAAQLFGAKGRNRSHDWSRILGVTQPIKPKIKTLGAFLKAFPDVQTAFKSTNIHLPYQLTTTPVVDEFKRLRSVTKTEDRHMSMLIDFRLDIMENPDEPIDELITTLHSTKYRDLGALTNKEMAYLWGVSIEYMTRVLNSALSKLQLNEDELKEKLIHGY